MKGSAMAFVRGVCGVVSTTLMPSEANTASEAAVNVASRSPMRWVYRCCGFF
jgi:hypothetical protein